MKAAVEKEDRFNKLRRMVFMEQPLVSPRLTKYTKKIIYIISLIFLDVGKRVNSLMLASTVMEISLKR